MNTKLSLTTFFSVVIRAKVTSVSLPVDVLQPSCFSTYPVLWRRGDSDVRHQCFLLLFGLEGRWRKCCHQHSAHLGVEEKPLKDCFIYARSCLSLKQSTRGCVITVVAERSEITLHWMTLITYCLFTMFVNPALF